MIAIIGTAGRLTDGTRLSKQSFDAMVGKVQEIVQTHLKIKDEECEWISGGAAWADHVAVHLFNVGFGKSLTLALPCEWDHTASRFVDTGVNDWRTNPGQTANHYHNEFSKKFYKGNEWMTLQQIGYAITKGATIEVGAGFFERNTRVASADAVIAFTFGRGARLAEGGTADTMGKFLRRNGPLGAFHVDLNTWKIYENPTVP